MITPIIVPYRSETPRCPSCSKVEKKVEICGYCKYEYPEGDFPISIGWILVAGTLAGALIFPRTEASFSGGFSDYILGALLGFIFTLTLGLVFVALWELLEKTFKQIMK